MSKATEEDLPPFPDLPVEPDEGSHECSVPVHTAQGIAGVGLALIQMSEHRAAADAAGAKRIQELYSQGMKCVEAARVWLLADAERIVHGRRA